MNILAIDPGNVQSAFVVFDGERPLLAGKWANDTLLREIYVGTSFVGCSQMAIETLKPRGMPVAFETMQAQLWAGRFYEAWFQARAGGFKFALYEPAQMFRDEIKLHLCGRSAAKDSNVRQALIDRWGGESKAIGGKKCPQCKGKGWKGRDHVPCPEWLHPPGPLHRVTADMWAALAVAVTFFDTKLNMGADHEPAA